MMTATPNYLGIEGAARSGGLIWNQLHAEREDICDVLCKEPVATNEIPNEDERQDADWHRELLHGRLRKIDDALDRLMSGSYGYCCRCEERIDETKLEFDSAVAFCGDCWQREQSKKGPECLPSNANQTNLQDSPNNSCEGVNLESLTQFDTIHVRTNNSDYRIFMLDPKTGRALIEGGHLFAEPVEVTLIGSKLRGYTFRLGWIGIGLRIEFWYDDKVASTSPVNSFHIEHQVTADSEYSSLAS